MAIAHSSTTLPVGSWQVVPDGSHVGFVTRILGMVPVRGTYGGFDGELRVDPAGAGSGTLRIESATLTTGIKKRDKHLHSGDYFAAEEHPHLRFELEQLAPGAEGALTASGTLHIRDEAIAVSTPVSLEPKGQDGLRLEADLPVDHKATGLGWKAPKTVRVHLALVLERTR